MNTQTTHIITDRRRTAQLPLIAILAALAAALCPCTARAQMAVHPALDPALTPNMGKIALGSWGESVVDHAFRARGFEVIDPKMGPHILDLIAFKRDAAGRLIDVRAVEVKTRTVAGDLGLPGSSKNGVQLSAQKIAADFDKAIAHHPDARMRDLLKEIECFMRGNQDGFRAERHVLTVKDGRYTIYEGPTTTRTVGRPAFDGSLDKMLERLGKSPNQQTAAAARLNRTYLQAQRAAASLTSEAAEGAAGAGTRGAARAILPIPPVNPYIAAATHSVAAGLLTSGILAGMATYDWYQGEISDARLHEELLRAGGNGVAVSLATGAVLMLTPAAPGIVVIAVTTAVAIGADIAFDWVMERENEHLVPREQMIRYGFVPKPEDADRAKPYPTGTNPLREYLDASRQTDCDTEHVERQPRAAVSPTAPDLPTPS